MRINLISLLLMFLPNPLKIFFLNLNPKHQLHPTAKIGMFTYLDATSIHLGEHSGVGSFNYIKGLEHFELGKHSEICSRNRLTAEASDDFFKHAKDRKRHFILREYAGIVNDHFFDCNDTIEIGKYSIIAGFGTAFFTHGGDINESCVLVGPIRIGDYSMIGAKCLVLKGAVLPNCSVLAGNSTLHKPFNEDYGLYSGVPAKLVKTFDPAAKFFHRTEGYIE
jgi:acetyltransferase-like isoleucine patch superfamily enzyme